jgi:hypothetical protein
MQGAEQMSENEHLLNVYVSKHAGDSCADFLGYSLVTSPADVADRRITPGKWLVRGPPCASCKRRTATASQHFHCRRMHSTNMARFARTAHTRTLPPAPPA